jgi:gluconate 2-dehydrogenase alpha chain
MHIYETPPPPSRFNPQVPPAVDRMIERMMAKSPDLGVVNTYGQHWDASNLFVLGASTFPNSGSANPTPTILALTYRTADAIVDKYLKKPGMLA